MKEQRIRDKLSCYTFHRVSLNRALFKAGQLLVQCLEVRRVKWHVYFWRVNTIRKGWMDGPHLQSLRQLNAIGLASKLFRVKFETRHR